MMTRVVLADDHQIMRDGPCALLEREPGIEVIGQAIVRCWYQGKSRVIFRARST